jgi:hypothetical protein
MSGLACWQELTSGLRESFLKLSTILGIPIPRLKLVFPRSQKRDPGHPNFVVELRFVGDMATWPPAVLTIEKHFEANPIS